MKILNKTIKPQGFTLVELLVVISIIGLLSTLAVVAFNNARAKSRDAQRVANLRAVANAMELYYNVNRRYACTTGTSVAACTDLEPYLSSIATMNDPIAPVDQLCQSASGACVPELCNFSVAQGGTYQVYQIAFCLEVGSGSMSAGAHLMTEKGFQ